MSRAVVLTLMAGLLVVLVTQFADAAPSTASAAPAATKPPPGTINADALARQSGVPANYDGEPRSGDVSTQRSSTNVRLCGGAGGTYTHCETVVCQTANIYKNYNPSTDRFYDQVPNEYYNNGERVEVRDAPYNHTGARGVLVYTGPVYGWNFASRACLP